LISTKSDTVIKRRAADVGLYFLSPILRLLRRASLEELDLVAFLEGDDRFLEVRPLSYRPTHAFDLASDNQCLNALDPTLEEGRHRSSHVVFGGLAIHEERVLTELLSRAVHLLGDQRAFDDVCQVHASAPSRALAACDVSTSCLRRKTDSKLMPSGG